VVEPGDKSALVDAIKKAWTNQDRYREMKVKARKLIDNHFDKATQFDKFISHFYKLINAD